MKTTREYTYDAAELAKKVLETIEKIEDFSTANGYQIKGDLSEVKKSGLFSNPLKSKITDASKSMKKKINHAIYRIGKKMSLKTSNYFLHILFKDIMESETRVRILPSEKEIKIQDLRKKWKEAQKIADTLLLEYKTEKGSFYKDQILI